MEEEVVDNITKQKGLIDYLFDGQKYIDLFQSYKSIIIPIIILILWIIYCWRSKKRINRLTEIVINELKRQKKYIPHLFSEIDSTMEILRYYIYGKSWKRKIVKEFNLFYKKNKFLKKVYPNYKDIFHLSFFNSLKEINEIIEENINLYNTHELLKNPNPDYPQVEAMIANRERGCAEYFEKLRKKLNCINKKIILLKNTAGNGKTNLLANITEILIKLNRRVIFINSKDIRITNENSFSDYLRKRLNLYSILNKHDFIVKTYLRIFKLYIIIDAINENDCEDFARQLFNELDYLNTCNVKILISSRSEFFENRFGNYFNKENICIIDKNYEYFWVPSHVQNKIVEKYSKVFNVKFDNNIKYEKLFSSSLLFLRIFFEVNSNKTCTDISLYKYKLYKNYIEKLKEKYPKGISQIDSLITAISKEMVENNKFDQIDVNNLIGKELNHEFLIKLCDDNMLTCRKSILYKDTISEEEKEVIYFPFDELRDYCIAKFLFKDFSDNQDKLIASNKIYTFLDSLSKNYKSPYEGILHYLYLQFKDSNYQELCKNLLANYLFSKTTNGNKEEFSNLGLSIIFDSDKPLFDFEEKYIYIVIQDGNKIDFHNLVKFLAKQELNGSKLTIKFLLSKIYSFIDINDIAEYLEFYNIYSGSYWGKYIFLDLLKILYTCIEKDILADSFEFIVLLTVIFKEYSKIEKIIQCIPVYKTILDKIKCSTSCQSIKNEIDIIYNDLHQKTMTKNEILTELTRERQNYEFY